MVAELAGVSLLDGGIVTGNGREAMGYATGWGWSVFPLAFRAKLPLFGKAHPGDPELQRSCRGRCGRVGHGFYDATTDPMRIASWWTLHPQAGVAIRTGLESGLLVVDVDTRNGGQTSLAHLVGDYEPLDCPEVETGGGGSHLYLAHPGGDLLDHLVDYPGIDVQGEGAYVVAPPSLHPRGRRYRWAWGRPWTPPPCPGWLAELLRPPPPATPTRSTSSRAKIADGSRYWQAALVGELQRLRQAPIGQRRKEVCRAACRLGRLAEVSGLGRDRAREVAEAAILEVADGLGWPARATTRQRIADAWALGLAHPRRPE